MLLMIKCRNNMKNLNRKLLDSLRDKIIHIFCLYILKSKLAVIKIFTI